MNVYKNKEVTGQLLSKAEKLKGFVKKLEGGENLNDEELKQMGAIKPHDVLGYSEQER